MPASASTHDPIRGPNPPTNRLGPRSQDEIRKFRLAALIVFGVLAAMFVLVLIVASMSQPTKAERAQAHKDAIANPQSIAQPNYGTAPTHPGDPGGWEQLTLGGLLVVAIGGAAAWLVHSSRKARRDDPVVEPQA